MGDPRHYFVAVKQLTQERVSLQLPQKYVLFESATLQVQGVEEVGLFTPRSVEQILNAFGNQDQQGITKRLRARGSRGGTGTFRQDVEQFLNTLLKNADLTSEDGCKEVSRVCGIRMPDTHQWVAFAFNSVMESNFRI